MTTVTAQASRSVLTKVLTPALVLVMLTVGAAQAQLSKIEKKLVANVDAHRAEALKLLEEVVNINSGTMNFEGVQKVGQIFRAKLDALGFTTQWIDGKPFQRAGHLVARHAGKGKTILLIGHLDTVFELSSPFQKYTVENDSVVHGPGVGDMKGGDVVIIQSLQALNDAGLLKDMSIIVVMTGDEELSGEPLALSKYDLIEAAKVADIAIGFEDGDGLPETANISRRSSSDWTLKVTGVPAHSSQIFTDKIGAGAIYEASRILNLFYNDLSKEPDLTFNPGVILGGSTVEHDINKNGGSAFGKGNIVSKEVIVTGDIRTISPEQLDKARETMKRIVAQHLPQTNAEITFDEGYPPLAATPGNYELLKHFDKVSRDMGFGPVTANRPRDAGAADISFTSGYVDMAIDGLGLGSAGGHTVHEIADPRTLAMQSKRTAVLLYRLTREKVSSGR
ncbi:M20/M25/M40 family metallo-hydrolase [Chryseolinea lacunae]|uniref:M20/M25/M40 family metallo-hydrolase n=1 Tax=Chryseolinea lacunae TaxID=2801331 RepID=A0ABS1KLS8_9BACT|nr:M20/M25/M40 family metallo-hydrolase [Chryseolinea lacunae]MBL0740409.1 M20/M25/M40 family metallo-hydrolase [Chryseolinea lacunae]